MFCKNCGREQQANERFCAQCGTPYESARQANAPVIPNIPNIPVSGSAPVPPPISQASPVAPAIPTNNPIEHRCPNCGANYTNTTNCEYCGSLLVRFVEKGIDLTKTSYTDDSKTLPGLTAELKRNLKLQEQYPDKSVVTDMAYCTDEGTQEYISVFRTGYCAWRGGNKPIELGENDEGLIILLNFETYTEAGSEEFNNRIESELQKFRQLPSFSLFTSHNCISTDERGDRRYVREYAIDFGKDAEGAARLISEIMLKLYGWTLNTPFDIYTEVGHDDIDKARKAWDEAHGVSYNHDYNDNDNDNDNDDNNEDDGIDWKYWICFILAALFFLYNFLNR